MEREISAKQGKKRTNVSESEKQIIKQRLKIYPAVSAIAKEFNVEIGVVKQIQQQIQQEKFAKTHTEAEFRIKRQELLNVIKSTNRNNITSVQSTIICHRANVLINEYSKYMTTQYDYALISYAYVMSRQYQRAIDLAEEHLKLEKSSLTALEEKIKEVMFSQDKNKETSNTATTNVRQTKSNEER